MQQSEISKYASKYEETLSNSPNWLNDPHEVLKTAYVTVIKNASSQDATKESLINQLISCYEVYYQQFHEKRANNPISGLQETIF